MSDTSIPNITNAPARAPLGNSREAFFTNAQPVNVANQPTVTNPYAQYGPIIEVLNYLLLEMTRIRVGISDMCNRDLANEVTSDDTATAI